MAHSWVSMAGWLTLASTVGFAWWKGSAAERWGASWVLTMYVASDLAMAVTYPIVPQIPLFFLDFLLAAGLLVLAIRYSSLWLGAAMLLQSVALLEHGLILGGAGLRPYYWMMLNNAISQLMQLCIIIASVISWRRRTQKPPLPAFEMIGGHTAG